MRLCRHRTLLTACSFTAFVVFNVAVHFCGNRQGAVQPSLLPTILLTQGHPSRDAQPPVRKSQSAEVADLRRSFSEEIRRSEVNSVPTGVVPAEVTQPDLGPRDSWKNVTYTQGKFFIYSAYFERRLKKKFVRIIATGRIRLPPTLRPLHCIMYFKNDSRVVVTAEHKVIRENWGLAYTARFVFCPTDAPPLRVSLVEKLNDPHPATVPVQDVQPSSSHLGDFAVCVKPFHYQYDRAVWLVEFIEFHRLLGVSQFVFYNHTVGPAVERVLRYYSRRGIVTVMPWHIQLRSQKEIRTENMFAALNDCLYRTMYRYRYALLVDVDEYIVPRQHADYGDMFGLLAGRGRDSYGSFMFKNCFFYLYWENDTAVAENLHLSPLSQFPYLISLYKTRRMRDPFRFSSRSKYFVVPDRVVEVGNHQVWEHAPGFKAMLVGEHYGLVHHYRICEMGGFDCMKKPSMVDRTTHKYISQLAGQVLTLCAAIFGASCPEAPPLGSPW